MFKIKGYRKHIKKHVTNTTILVYIVSVVNWKKNGCNTDGGRKIFLRDFQSSILYSMIKIGTYRKQIQKHTRNTMGLVYIVYIVDWKISILKNGYKANGQKKKQYLENSDHHYFTQC